MYEPKPVPQTAQECVISVTVQPQRVVIAVAPCEQDGTPITGAPTHNIVYDAVAQKDQYAKYASVLEMAEDHAVSERGTKKLKPIPKPKPVSEATAPKSGPAKSTKA